MLDGALSEKLSPQISDRQNQYCDWAFLQHKIKKPMLPSFICWFREGNLETLYNNSFFYFFYKCVIRVSLEKLNQASAQVVVMENIVQSMILPPVSPVQRDRPLMTWKRIPPIIVLVRNKKTVLIIILSFGNLRQILIKTIFQTRYILFTWSRMARSARMQTMSAW